MMGSRADERTRLLVAMADGAWYEPAGLPEHRRRCYSILNELAKEGAVEQRNQDGEYAWRLAGRDALLPYSSTHPPAYVLIRQDPAPTWKAWWVWPEEKMRGAGPLTLCCAHRHREYARAVRCAKSRCGDVRETASHWGGWERYQGSIRETRETRTEEDPMNQQVSRVYAHEVLTTRQGTAMPETALCGHHLTPVLIRKALNNALASEDWDGNGGFTRAFDNPELHCIECGA